MHNAPVRRQRVMELTRVERVKRKAGRVARTVHHAGGRAKALWRALKARLRWRWRALKFKSQRLWGRCVRAWWRLWR